MASSSSPLLAAFVFLLCCSCRFAFNITDILSQYPDFNSFNSYLSLTGAAGEINRRQTITVLAVNNAAMSSIVMQPLEVIKNVLAVHVILDYYDPQKFWTLVNGTTYLVTMFQATGLAIGQMGFLNATDFPWGVALGSAVPGAGLNSNLVQSVFAEPYNISVLQVSAIIMPPGIAGTAQPFPPPPPPPPAPIPAAAPPKSTPAPKISPQLAPKSSSAGPAASSTPAPQPAEAVPTVAPTSPELTPSNPAFPPTTPYTESPVQPPATAGVPSSGLTAAGCTGVVAASAILGAMLLGL